MKRKVSLTFGERMREWRKARKEYAEKVKAKLKEKMEVEQNYPPQPGVVEKSTFITSPTQATEMKSENASIIPNPTNAIERALNRLREKAAEINL